ncbi:MAG TPA: Flp family type IVb pilin [Blastocatellia bacterium]|nr:Flp family type IVb pilin [Blastocatellia bacterium]
MKEFLIEFLKDDAGQSIVEYSLLLTLIGASTVFMLTLMGLSISRMMGMTDITVQNYTSWAYEKFRAK